MNCLNFLARAACALALALTLLPTATATTKPVRVDIGERPKFMLWVGHSYFFWNNNIYNHFGQLTASLERTAPIAGTAATIGGAGLDWHDMAALLKPGRIGRYTLVGDNELRFNPPERTFDTVIMMDCSQCPIHPQLQSVFHETVASYSGLVKASGKRPVLFMTWAYKDKPEMTAPVAEQYTLAGNAHDALVIPAGLAFANAMGRRPDVELYFRDKRHPSIAGTYLAACTSYASLTGKSPVGASYTAGLPEDVALFLQTVAWETVRAYQGR